MKKTSSKSKKSLRFPVTVVLNAKDFALFKRICAERNCTRADFFRGALSVWREIPTLKTRPLSGIALVRVKAKEAREKRAKRRKG